MPALASRPFFDLGKIFGHPVNNKRLILLKRSPDRALRTETKLVQQSSHRDIAQANIKLASDQYPHYTPGPKRRGEFKLSRISAGNQTINLLQRCAGKFRQTVAGFATPQRFDSTFPVLSDSFVNARTSEPKRINDHVGTFPRLNSLHGTYAYCFKRLSIYFTPIEFVHGLNMPHVH